MGELSTKAIDGYVAIDVHPVLQRVPAQVREGKLQIYDPVLVSLGPYHHGDSRFQEVEDLKADIVAELFPHGGDQKKLLEEIRTQSREIRTFYSGIPQKSIDDDEALARMMLLDASFLVYFLRMMADHGGRGYTVLRRLGMSRLAFVLRDFFMLENQLPFSVLKKAVASTRGYEFESIDEFFHEFLSSIYYHENMATMTQLPWVNGRGKEPPLHLLDALHRMLLHPAKTDQDQDEDGEGSSANRLPPKNYWQLFHRSATDLKAKGVHFVPSSHSLKDISFCSFFTHGRLHLPMFYINNNTMALLSNLVAHEMTLDRTTDLVVIPYVNFMKTLVRRVEDVTLLQEKGILYGMLANDEEVVGLFQDIDTYGVPSSPNLDKVGMRIEAHCNGRGKTWLAELINTYFRSPLTAVALFAAAFILVLTFLQTFYTINPRYANAAP